MKIFPENVILKTLWLFFCILLSAFTTAQKKQLYKTAIVAFYNCENFYDTINDPLSRDDEFTPKGEKHYDSKIYSDKLQKIATVISKIGSDDDIQNHDGPAILGVAEVENKNVLTDLITHPALKKINYQYIHYDSKDERGIDVALLYNPKYFIVEASKPIYVRMRGYYYTRDILWVKGKLDGETIHVYVNHWPSRIGGEEQTETSRIIAARVLKNHIDSILKADGSQKIIIMGDFNDDPINKSINDILKAKQYADDVTLFGLFNPFAELYKKGIGSILSRDVWSLFDQLILSYPWLNKKQEGFFFYQSQVFNRSFLTENTGRYKGYPMRTWDGNTYRGGYSDHFPSYVVLLKRVH